MKYFKLSDTNLFITEGGFNEVKVMRFKGVHSPRVNYQNWEFVGIVGINSDDYTGIDINGRVIEHRDLQKLIFDLESTNLLINCEGYCYIHSSFRISSSTRTQRTQTDHFKNIEYYRLNDIFMWSDYQVNSMYTFNWNRHDIYTNEAIIDTNTSKMKRDYENRIRILQNENDKKLRDSQGDSENEMRLQNKLDDTRSKLQHLQEENRKLQGFKIENKKLQDLLAYNEKTLKDLRDENKRLLVSNKDKGKVSKYDHELIKELQDERKKVQELEDKIKSLQELQGSNEEQLHNLQHVNNDLKMNEKKLKSLQDEKDVLQRKLDDTISHSQVSPQPLSQKGRYSFPTNDYNGVLRYFRPSRPDQFIFEIQCFSDLEKTIDVVKCDKFESPEFEAAGQKWMLCIYLKGDPDEDTENHISLSLKKLPDQSSRVDNMKVLLRFFIYSYKYKEYLTIQELIVQNFNDQFDMEAGIPQALKIDDFREPKNGFIYGGKCRFGIEVFNMRSHPQTFTLTTVKKLYHGSKCICKFNHFSKLPLDGPAFSDDEFQIDITSIKNRTVAYLWKVQIYRTGIDENEDKNVSIFLELVSREKVSSGRQLFADFEIRLKCHDQSIKNYSKRGAAWFTQTEYNHGFDDFIPIDEFTIKDKYTKDDSVTVEVYFYNMFRMEDV